MTHPSEQSIISHYSQIDRLKDGRRVFLRAISSDDKSLLQEVMHHLSPQSIYFRFLTPKKELTDRELAYFTEVDSFHHVALLASIDENGARIPIGVGRYIMHPNPREKEAEVAFTVEEDFQGMGVGTLLLRHLTELARLSGIEKFTALVLPENHKMLDVFAHSGLPMHQSSSHVGVLDITLDLT